MLTSKKIYDSCALLIALLAVLFICPHPASAGAAGVPSYLPYPSADSVILNPYGQADESAQLIDSMQPFYRIACGRDLTIEQMPGRGGATAWGSLADRPGDGYTLALTNLQSLILRTMSSRPVFGMPDLFNCNIMAEAALVLWVPENSPFPNITELTRSARAYPSQLIISGAGSNTQTHLATLRLNYLAGIKTIYLPYIGTSTAMEATKLGQAHAAWGLPLAGHGRSLGMRPLAVAAAQRLSNLPDVPTFAESGLDFFETAHFGLALPAGTPPGTRQAVSAHFGLILENSDFQRAIAQIGFTPKSLDSAATSALVEDESKRLAELLAQFDLE